MTSIHEASSRTVSPRVLRIGALTLGAAGLLLVLYPAVRPWHDETTVSGATASMGSAAWVAAHLFAILGLILLPFGLFSAYGLLAGSRGGSLAMAGVVTTWLGVGLCLPYYGAEDFALHAIARRTAAGGSDDLLALVAGIRFSPVAATMFAVGLVLVAVGGVLMAAAIWRGWVLPRWCGVPLGLGLALFLPQFYLPPWARIGHGVQLAAALCLLAVAVWTTASSTSRRPSPSTTVASDATRNESDTTDSAARFSVRQA